MGLFSKLFGGGSQDAPAESDPVEHEGWTLVAAPISEGGQYRTAGVIRREVDGEIKEARFIRADNHASRDAAVEHSLRKARQIVDEQGMGLLKREQV
jgi:hypothetical protein